MNNNKSAIIEGTRIDLTPYLSRLDEDVNIVSMKALGYMVKEVSSDNRIIEGEPKRYATFPKDKKYSVRFPSRQMFTNEEGANFVHCMLTKSNFAKAKKIAFVLTRNDNKLCGVITEDF